MNLKGGGGMFEMHNIYPCYTSDICNAYTYKKTTFKLSEIKLKSMK